MTKEGKAPHELDRITGKIKHVLMDVDAMFTDSSGMGGYLEFVLERCVWKYDIEDIKVSCLLDSGSEDNIIGENYTQWIYQKIKDGKIPDSKYLSIETGSGAGHRWFSSIPYALE